MLKPTWEALYLNISAPRQKLKDLVTKIHGKELLYPIALIIFLLASKLRKEM